MSCEGHPAPESTVREGDDAVRSGMPRSLVAGDWGGEEVVGEQGIKGGVAGR